MSSSSTWLVPGDVPSGVSGRFLFGAGLRRRGLLYDDDR